MIDPNEVGSSMTAAKGAVDLLQSALALMPKGSRQGRHSKEN
jgi:hypothetical protein